MISWYFVLSEQFFIYQQENHWRWVRELRVRRFCKADYGDDGSKRLFHFSLSTLSPKKQCLEKIKEHLLKALRGHDISAQGIALLINPIFSPGVTYKQSCRAEGDISNAPIQVKYKKAWPGVGLFRI
jgi:hypothetical protein